MTVLGLKVEDKQGHWNTMLALKDSIKHMTENNEQGVYNHHIQNNLATLWDFLTEYRK